MGKIKQHIKLLSFIGLALIGMLVINSALFTHSQTLADGSIVVHAHPYSKTNNPPQDHTHHEDELLILSNISLFFFIAAVSFNFIEQFLNHLKNDLIQVEYIDILLLQRLGRAPPIS